MSAGGGHAAGGLDELRLMSLSMGPILEMDSNMQHDDDSQPKRLHWLPESDTDQSEPHEAEHLKSALLCFGQTQATLFFKFTVMFY